MYQVSIPTIIISIMFISTMATIYLSYRSSKKHKEKIKKMYDKVDM